jgi:hypothetical protein
MDWVCNSNGKNKKLKKHVHRLCNVSTCNPIRWRDNINMNVKEMGVDVVV